MRLCGENIIEGILAAPPTAAATAIPAYPRVLRELASDLERVGWHLLHSMKKDRYSYEYQFPGGHGDAWMLHRSDGGPAETSAIGRFGSVAGDQQVVSDGHRYLFVVTDANDTVIDAQTGSVRAQILMPRNLHDDDDAIGDGRRRF
jgi:hypothetical protein